MIWIWGSCFATSEEIPERSSDLVVRSPGLCQVQLLPCGLGLRMARLLSWELFSVIRPKNCIVPRLLCVGVANW